jgi:hypothetical protein
MTDHLTLDLHGTSCGVNGAGKLDEHPVASGLYDASSMGGYRRIDESFSNRLEPGQGAFLIGTHETAISGDIRRQYSRQSPFYALASQRRLQLESSARRIKAYLALAGLGPTSYHLCQKP